MRRLIFLVLISILVGCSESRIVETDDMDKYNGVALWTVDHLNERSVNQNLLRSYDTKNSGGFMKVRPPENDLFFYYYENHSGFGEKKTKEGATVMSKPEYSGAAIIVSDYSYIEKFDLPYLPIWGTMNADWIGENIFIHYASNSIVNKNKFFVLDINKKEFIKLKVPRELSSIKHLQSSTDFNINSHPTRNNVFALSYCLATNLLGECIKLGFGLGDSNKIEQVLSLDVRKGNMEWGWHSDRLFIKQNSDENSKNNKVYIINFEGFGIANSRLNVRR